MIVSGYRAKRSVAMGNGTDVAMHAAGITPIRDDGAVERLGARERTAAQALETDRRGGVRMARSWRGDDGIGGPEQTRRNAMNIGEAARQSGVSAKMIRHYEAIGLLPPAPRSETGYRRYGDNDAATLRFIRAARELGFGLDEIGELLSLWRRRDRTSREVKALAQTHIEALEAKVAELDRMVGALRNLIAHCHGDHRPDCPILDGLEQGAVAGGAVGSPIRGTRKRARAVVRNS